MVEDWIRERRYPRDVVVLERIAIALEVPTWRLLEQGKDKSRG